MEAHAVHYNQKYSDFKEAADKHDGLAVVAFFLQATDNHENQCFHKLSEAVKDIVKINSETTVPSGMMFSSSLSNLHDHCLFFNLDCLTWIKEEAQCKGYYTYRGSLTTKPYNESVTWIIYPTPIHVSRDQVRYEKQTDEINNKKSPFTGAKLQEYEINAL